MSKVTVFAKFACQEGKNDEMEAALAALVTASEGVEGVESYSYHRGDGNNYWFFALMTNMDATRSHAESPGMQAAMQQMQPLLAGPPDMAMTTPIAANGLDI